LPCMYCRFCALFINSYYSLLTFSFLTLLFFFFFTPPSTSHLYTLSLHDALPIFPALSSRGLPLRLRNAAGGGGRDSGIEPRQWLGRKSTRLNSSHDQISYAVFCLKKKIILIRTKINQILNTIMGTISMVIVNILI